MLNFPKQNYLFERTNVFFNAYISGCLRIALPCLITFGLYGITEFDSIPLVCKVKEIASVNKVVKST